MSDMSGLNATFVTRFFTVAIQTITSDENFPTVLNAVAAVAVAGLIAWCCKKKSAYRQVVNKNEFFGSGGTVELKGTGSNEVDTSQEVSDNKKLHKVKLTA